MNHSLYVGPFVVCQNELIKKSVIERTCPNRECERHGGYTALTYCGECGEFIPNEGTPAMQLRPKVDAGAVVERLDERLRAFDDKFAYVPGVVDYYVQNTLFSDEPRDFYFSDFEGVKEGMFDAQSEREWLARAFSKEIAILCQIYGIDNVRVSWGVLGEFN